MDGSTNVVFLVPGSVSAASTVGALSSWGTGLVVGCSSSSITRASFPKD
jgi:hypothetical protein